MFTKLPHVTLWRSALFIPLSLLAISCVYQSDTLEALRCDTEGQQANGRICRDGIWVANSPMMDASVDLPDLPADLVTSDMSSDTSPDLREDMAFDMRPDMMQDMPADMPDDMSDMPPDMPQEVCGDGKLTANEQCDDGNTNPNDGCDRRCQITTGWRCPQVNQPCTPECGDGLVVGAEQCDDGNTNPNDGCDATCQLETGWTCPQPNQACVTNCGDGLIVGTEQCDDNNIVNQDGCSGLCQIDNGWTCQGQPSRCMRDSTVGNGQIDGNERCDDGNATNNDGCDDMGQIEPGYICPTPNTPCQRVTGVTTGPISPLTTAGGMGGGAFVDRCDTNEFVVGIEGYEHDLNVLNGGAATQASLARTRVICGRINILQTGALTWSNPKKTSWRGTEKRNNLGAQTCRQNEFMIGYSAHYGDLVYGIRPVCASFQILDGQLQRGTERPLSLHGFNAGPQTLNRTLCSSDALIVGVAGRSGWMIDQLTFQCGQMSLAP